MSNLIQNPNFSNNTIWTQTNYNIQTANISYSPPPGTQINTSLFIPSPVNNFILSQTINITQNSIINISYIIQIGNLDSPINQNLSFTIKDNNNNNVLAVDNPPLSTYTSYNWYNRTIPQFTANTNILNIVMTFNNTDSANSNSIYLTGIILTAQEPPTPKLSNFIIPTQIYGNAPFTLVDPSSNSNGTFSYTTSNPNVATISGNTVTIIGGGTSTITATQAATTNYTSGTITATLTVNQQLTTLSGFTIPTQTYGNAPFTLVDPSSNSNGTFSYTTSNPNVATISGNTVTIIGSGTSTITATQAATTNYTLGTITATLTVNLIQNSNFSNNTAWSPSSNIITSNTGPNSSITTSNSISITQGTYTKTLSLTQTINIPYNSNINISYWYYLFTNYSASGGSTLSLEVTDINNIILAKSNPSLNTQQWYNITIPTFYFNSGNLIITITGYCDNTFVIPYVSGKQSGSNNLNFTGITLTAEKIILSTLSDFTIPTQTYGNAQFTLVDPSSNSNGTFSYTSSNPNVATISGNTVTIIGGGTSTITATQAHTTNYTSGTITATLTVNQQSPTLGNFTIPIQTYGNARFTIVDASSNSNGTFSYTTSNPNVVTISGNTVTIIGGGTSTITATQAPTTNYTLGTITATLTVNQQSPTLGDFTIPTQTYGNAPFTIVDPSSNSNGIFKYTSSNPNVATISGNTVTIIGGGTSTITATQAPTTNYTSGTTTATLTVNQQSPTLGDFTIPTQTYGNAPFTIVDPSSNSNGTFSYTSSNPNVATISGNTVTIIGGGTSTITATQAPTTNYILGTTTATLIVNNSIVCFKEDTEILTNIGYRKIQDLKTGDLIKTINNGYIPINMIGMSEIYNSGNDERIKDKLYLCSKTKYNELFEDLVITGAHSILVDNFTCDEQMKKVNELLGKIYITGNKYRLPACVDERTEPYKKEGIFKIYHIALENDNYYSNYGIYANGLLVESCSKRYLKELSNMNLL